MRFRAILLLLLVPASCSPDAPAPAPAGPMVEVVPPQEAPATPAPAPAPPPPPPPVVKPAPVKDDADFKVAVAIPLEPAKEEPAVVQRHLPAFNFRTMNHAQVEVQVNGVRLSTTPCLWSVCDTIEFDPEIKVPDWPPPGAKFAGTTKRLLDNKAGIAEIYIAHGEDLQPKLPHLRAGDHVLYVKGKVAGRPLLGALRLSVGSPGRLYRFVEYAAVMDTESENSSRFQRTLWFENRE